MILWLNVLGLMKTSKSVEPHLKILKLGSSPCVIPVSGAFHAATCLGRFAKTTMADETNGTNGEAGDVSLPEGWRKSGNMTY